MRQFGLTLPRTRTCRFRGYNRFASAPSHQAKAPELGAGLSTTPGFRTPGGLARPWKTSAPTRKPCHPDIARRQNRVLRNTYALLALSMAPTVAGALIGMQLNFSFLAGSPFIAFMLFLGVAWGFMWGIEKTKNSGMGVAAAARLHLLHGPDAVAHPAGGARFLQRRHADRDGGRRHRSDLRFAGGVASTTKRDFSNLGKFLTPA
jgi:hypothetical protein